MARGGYATVYRATQDSVGREVAIKVENRTLEDPRDQARFLREAKAAGRMSSHPHVVDLFDVGVTVDQHPYLIMELCDGSYLDRMRACPLGAVEARDLGVKIADALVHSHAAGVLHRDVKPANILYSQFNPAVLADFGLAVLGEIRDSSVTLEVLTPAYAPPEMFRHATPSPAVDVYALCATLYAVMRGRPARWETDRSPSIITLMELFDQPIPDLPGVPRALTDILRYGMATEPRARPTAEQLRELLSGLHLGPAGNYPPPAPPTSGGTPVGLYRSGGFTTPRPVPPVSTTHGMPPSEDETPTVNTDRRQRRKRRWLFGGFGAAVLIGASLAGGWLASTPRPSLGVIARLVAPSTRVTGATGSPVTLPGCATQLPSGGRCPERLECFEHSPDGEHGTTQVACTTRHSWEVFAVGTLPEGIEASDRDAVITDRTVRQVCSSRTFRITTAAADPSGWALSVLPPAAEAVRAGDRTFRCLAGRGEGRLRAPALIG